MFSPKFRRHFFKIFFPNSIKNCVLYADHKRQGVTCSFAAPCDVMNVRSSSVTTQFGETCLAFPRLICKDLHAQRALYNSYLYILRSQYANFPAAQSAWRKQWGTMGEQEEARDVGFSCDQWGRENRLFV